MSQITSSTTERVFEYGALNTATPCVPAYSRSTWLVPMQKQPTAESPWRASMTLRVTEVLERMPSRSTPSSASISSSSFSAPLSVTTSNPCLRRDSAANG